MGNMYSLVFAGVSVSAQQDLFSFVAPGTGPICIHSLTLSQVTATGDASEKDLTLQIRNGASTVGSGGTIVTPNPTGLNGSAFPGSGARVNDTTVATGGTITTLYIEAWNIRSGFVYTPTPECRIWVPASARSTVTLTTTPASAYSMHGTLFVEAL